jgi:hypothetical protein
MPALDPIAHRVARRHMAKLEIARRVAIEYQRRRHGLEPVGGEDEDDGQGEDREDEDDAQVQ